MASWNKNRRLVRSGFIDLEYVPAAKDGWDCTLCTLGYGSRLSLDKSKTDLCLWAEHNRIPPSLRYQQFGSSALVLWHGTSRERAEKIIEHGLFHKGGLWTTVIPQIAHSYCRNRSVRFSDNGAMVCMVLDKNDISEGVDFDFEQDETILRFHHRIPSDAVEYVFYNDHVEYRSERVGKRIRNLPGARFRQKDGMWIPVQRNAFENFGKFVNLDEFCRISIEKYLNDFRLAASIELFSMLYSSVYPTHALIHDDILELIEDICVIKKMPGKRTILMRKAPV